jgi:hypothetical protein
VKFVWVVTGVLVALLSACGGGTPQVGATPGVQVSIAPTQGTTADRQPEPLVAKGHVTNAAGRPLAGAVINADWQLSDEYSIDGTTDANGDYRIALDPPQSSWHMNGSYSTTWNGTAYMFDLDPVDDSNFVGTDGGVRDFVWRLTGETPEGGAFYGGTVQSYMDFSGEIPIDPQYVHLTLTPDGPLVDGSMGTVVTATGDRLDDVAVGRYDVTAAYVEPGKDTVGLLVRVRNQGDYAPSVTAQFEQVSATGQQLELEVRSN